MVYSGQFVLLLGALSIWSKLTPCQSFVAPRLGRLSLPPCKRPAVYRERTSYSALKRTPSSYPLKPRQSFHLLGSTSSYVPPDAPEVPVTGTKKKGLWPQIGDIVRFYELDGGDERGQILVGRISFIQKNLGKEGSGWSLEIAELDDVGSGYFADYPFQKRGSKKTMRDLGAVSPIAASFVRTESAFKVPLDTSGIPRVRQESYDIESYPGPFVGENAINQEVVQADAEIYGALKSKLFRYAALTGMAGTIVTDLSKGFEDAAIYFAGVVASLLYLFFLTVKTDTVASQEAKLGSNVSNLRFVTPLVLLVGIAFYNKSLGDASPVAGQGPFATVTAEQFAAAVLGFLTYRIPLFLTQLADAYAESGELVLPGSAGVAMQLAKQETEENNVLTDQSATNTVLLVSGPQATGRSELVDRLVEKGQGKYVRPKTVDRSQNPATFERLEKRDDFLFVDPSERYGLTKEGILSSCKDFGADSVVVIDADVELARKLKSLAGVRLVGVWVGLNNVKDFERRLGEQVDTGVISIPEGEDRDSVIRARIRDIVSEIEFGISSGMFEFTIILTPDKDQDDDSLRQLQEAASYCFK